MIQKLAALLAFTSASAGLQFAKVIGTTPVVVAQAEALGGEVGTTVIPAAALTATSGALVWVVRQIVSGKLVHRDPTVASDELTKTLSAATAALEAGAEREKIVLDLMREVAYGDRTTRGRRD